jgi:hypothetical protein
MVMSDYEIEKYGIGWSDEAALPIFNSYSAKHNVELPESFLQFYSRFNGFKIKDIDFEFAFDLKEKFWHRSLLTFHGFLSATDIISNLAYNEGVTYPVGTVPFIDIELANICVSLRKDSFGAIYFCETDPLPEQVDNNAESTEEELKNFDPSKGKLSKLVLKLADNFEEFMSQLRAEEWD